MLNDFHQTEWDALLEDECRRLVRAAVLEDLDRGQDWTTLALVPMETTGKAVIVARQAGVIVGLPAVQIIIDEMDPRLQFELHRQSDRSVSDGDAVEPGSQLGIFTGPARSLLTAERLILNFLGRLSGIATQTRRFVELVAGTKARVYDTRKTTPGWRRLEKYAVRQGGGHNHRTGLFDAILIKDNHLALGNIATGDTHFSPSEAVRRARQFIVENFPDDDPRAGCWWKWKSIRWRSANTFSPHGRISCCWITWAWINCVQRWSCEPPRAAGGVGSLGRRVAGDDRRDCPHRRRSD